MRQRVAELGLGSWFHPSVTIWRKGEKTNPQGVILPGDLLHTDFGIVYLGFSTDTQHNAYVLKPGETDAPKGLQDGLKAGNRLQDLTQQFARPGRTGNQALADALLQATKEGLVPSIYCHPIGYHGHAAGPPIGMTDYQNGVPVRGRLRLPPQHVAFDRVERHVQREGVGRPARSLRSRGRRRPAPGGKWDWVDGRQERLYLIQP